MTSSKNMLTMANSSYLMDVAKRKCIERSEDLLFNHSTVENEISELDNWKVNRIARLREIHDKRREYLDKGCGSLEVLSDEKELISAAQANTRVLCHFYEEGFERCKILDSLLTSLASRFLDTKFVKIMATKAPFFTHKIGIKILPTLLAIIDGNITKIYIGFQEFGGDKISINTLRNTLLRHNLLTDQMGIQMMKNYLILKIRRSSEKVFLDLFNSISKGKNRIPLKTALNRLNSFFNSNVNPYKRNFDEDSTEPKISSEEFMNQFYSRNIEKRHGLRSQFLMVGGPKNLRGNPRGPMDANLYFPQITFEQFFGIAKDMECIYLELFVQGSMGTKLTKFNNTKELQRIQKNKNKELLNIMRSK